MNEIKQRTWPTPERKDRPSPKKLFAARLDHDVLELVTAYRLVEPGVSDTDLLNAALRSYLEER